MGFSLREFGPADGAAVDALGLLAFEELRDYYSDWSTYSIYIGRMSTLAQSGELIVATVGGLVAGAVTYVGPGRPKRDLFPVEWPIVRMLAVAPVHRGLGIGRALMLECVRRAQRDGAPLIALHTSAIMKVALPMYERMGFTLLREAPPLFGVPYGIYVKELSS